MATQSQADRAADRPAEALLAAEIRVAFAAATLAVEMVRKTPYQMRKIRQYCLGLRCRSAAGSHRCCSVVVSVAIVGFAAS